MPGIFEGANQVVFGAERVLFGDDDDAIYITVPLGVLSFGSGYTPVLSEDGMVITPPGTGAPSFPWTLFRGMVVGAKVERQGSLQKVTLDCEDYMRAAARIKVGYPETTQHEPDPAPEGTDTGIDAKGQTAGAAISKAFFIARFNLYWATIGLIVNTTDHTYEIPSGGSLPDFSTGGGDFPSFANSILAYSDPFAAWWLAPIGNEIVLWLTLLAPTGSVSEFAEFAPYSLIDIGDGPLGAGQVFAMDMTAEWDFRDLHRLFVTGASLDTSFWVYNPDGSVPSWAGEDLISAPGATVPDDVRAVALFAFARRFHTMLQGGAHIPPFHDGWRPGQTVWVTSSRLSTASRQILALPTIIRQISGKLVAPGPGMLISADGVDYGGDGKVTIGSFAFAQSIGGAEKATITLETVDPDVEFDIHKFADVRIKTDGTAAIEYDLTFGDQEVGDLSKALAPYTDPNKDKPLVKILPKFKVYISDPQAPLIPGVLDATDVFFYAQAVDQDDKPWALAGVIAEYILLQWADDARTIPGAGLDLEVVTGTTNETGKVFNNIVKASEDLTSVAYEIQVVALPV